MDFLVFLPVLLLSVVVHEVAHAVVARREGDDTAERLGRITLNPLPHLDLVGSFLLPLVLFLLPGDLIFGWAKPVPVDPRKFRDPRWSDVRVSLAGIVANLLLAFVSVLLVVAVVRLRWMAPGLDGVLLPLQRAAVFGIFINLILAVFNLVPVPPLDGSHVLYHLLPPAWRAPYRAAGRYGVGVLLLVVFLFPGAMDLLLWPVHLLMAAAERFIGLWV